MRTDENGFAKARSAPADLTLARHPPLCPYPLHHTIRTLNSLLSFCYTIFIVKSLQKFLTNRTIFPAIIILSIFTNFYQLEKTHLFEWDQERDAQVVYERIVQQKSPTLLGSRAVGPEGFFLGPLHYYILTPFYAATQGDPIAAPILTALIGVFTTAAYMFVAYKLFSYKSAVFAGLFSALLPQLTAWNVMYMPLLTILMYYCIYQIIQKRYSFLIGAFVVLSLAFQAHAAAIYLALQLTIVIIYIVAVDKSFKKVFRSLSIGLIIFTFSFTPLILFDVRHDFLNTKLLFGFLNTNTVHQGIDFTRALIIYIRNPNLLTFTHNAAIVAALNITLIILTFIAARIIFTSKKFSEKNQGVVHMIMIFSWIAVPLITLSLYSGTISEYYFSTVTSLTILFAAYLCAHFWKKQLRYVVGVMMIGLVIGNIKPVLTRDDPASLFYKKALVKYMADQHDPYFSLSYNVPLGRGYGFAYLLSYYGIKPDDTKPIPKYFLRIAPEIEENGLPEKAFGAYYLSKRVE